MDSEGFVKLWRKSIESSVFADPILWKLWCLCLMKANFKRRYVAIEGIASPVEILPGQFITGRFALHKEMYPRKKKNQKSPSTIWNKLQTLQNMQNLNIRSHAKFSIITISNWGAYQQNEQPANNRLTTGEQPANTDKNDKNEKKVNTPPNGNGKKEYREYVKLKPSEYERLLKEFGDTQTKWMIDTLDSYIGAMPKKRNKYTDHNRVLRGWVLEKYQTNNPAQRQQDIYEDLN